MTSRARFSAAFIVALATTTAAACTDEARGAPTTATSTTTTSVPETTTTASTTTTTTTPKGPSIADANAAIAGWAESREGITEISIGNLTSGAVSDITPGPQTPVRIASVMKVSIAIQYLRLLRQRHDDLTGNAIVKIGRMIQVSDNGDADDLWDASGKDEGLNATTIAAGMTQTAFQPGHGWGFSLTTAHDQALLETRLAQGRLLEPDDTRFVLGLMRNVQPSQRWGFADVVDAKLQPAVKNGWYEDRDDPVWRVNCTAVFDNATLAHPFAIAVLTKYPEKLGMAYGQDTCRGVAHLLGAWLTPK